MSWTKTKLSSVVLVIESGGRPKGGASEDSGEIPSLGGENILRTGGVTLEYVKRVPKRYYDSMKKGHLRNYDVLINKDGAQTGKVGLYVVNEPTDRAINEHVFLIRACEEKVTQEFLYYQLLSESGQRQIDAQISGSAQPGLKRGFLEGVEADIPESINEQSKIAEILSTVDRAIKQTESLIAKQQRIKTGLMQDLLTRGIDEQGNLRSEETHEFKDSPLGRIPVEWEIKKFKDRICLVHGHQFLEEDFSASGVAVVKIGQISDNGIDLKNCSYVPEDNFKKHEKNQLKFGDPLMALTGATLGKVCFISEEYAGVRLLQNYRVGVFREIEEKTVLNRFIFYLLQDRRLRTQIFSRVNSGAQGNIGKADFDESILSFPGYGEQVRIVQCIFLEDSHSLNLAGSLSKLRFLKTALMQDLLTGIKRVRPLLDPEVPA